MPKQRDDGQESTKPKPFLFVLMPFRDEFKDVYRFGIQGAAAAAGAYAERLDEQIFGEGMLDRIFSQINKADVIVADMTDRNPNVFYEVGYAHALDKVVVLLTRNAGDIPFDLQHRRHVVYDGSAADLQEKLIPELQWALGVARQGHGQQLLSSISVWMGRSPLPRKLEPELPVVSGDISAGLISSDFEFSVPMQLRNDSEAALTNVTHVYLFTEDTAAIAPTEPYTYTMDTSVGGYLGGIHSGGEPTLRRDRGQLPIDGHFYIGEDVDGDLVKQYRLPVRYSAIPPGASEPLTISFQLSEGCDAYDGPLKLRVHTSAGPTDFYFRMNVKKAMQKQEEEAERPEEQKP